MKQTRRVGRKTALLIALGVLGVGAGILLVFVGAGSGQEPAEEPMEEGFVSLFNGKDLTGLIPFLGELNAEPAKTWSVKEGAIVCTGQPNGYLRTEKEFDNFILRFQYRMMRAGNSGVFIHVQLPDKIWPKGIECQLLHTEVGRIFAVSGAQFVGGGVLRRPTKPLGEWNSYEIVSRDGMVVTVINGKTVAVGANADPKRGYIVFQSEGTEIHFRNITIKELK